MPPYFKVREHFGHGLFMSNELLKLISYSFCRIWPTLETMGKGIRKKKKSELLVLNVGSKGTKKGLNRRDEMGKKKNNSGGYE